MRLKHSHKVAVWAWPGFGIGDSFYGIQQGWLRGLLVFMVRWSSRLKLELWGDGKLRHWECTSNILELHSTYKQAKQIKLTKSRVDFHFFLLVLWNGVIKATLRRDWVWKPTFREDLKTRRVRYKW
jgi:hypothetical protein